MTQDISKEEQKDTYIEWAALHLIDKAKEFVGIIKDFEPYPKTEHIIVQPDPRIFDGRYAFCLYLGYSITTNATMDLVVLAYDYGVKAIRCLVCGTFADIVEKLEYSEFELCEELIKSIPILMSETSDYWDY